ncbi:hypothetical protein GJ496_002347 [Pomphorhynchus laevis]|nr:hypothetical protein GJ496_002347 [Pomphorhynchus laevis]
MADDLNSSIFNQRLEIERIVQQLIEYEYDDLSNWSKAIQFIINNYPRPGRGRYLWTIVQQCCKHFYLRDNVKNNADFFAIYKIYARFGNDNHRLFQHLFKNNVFNGLSEFWESWFGICSAQGNQQMFKEVFALLCSKSALSHDEIHRIQFEISNCNIISDEKNRSKDDDEHTCSQVSIYRDLQSSSDIRNNNLTVNDRSQHQPLRQIDIIDRHNNEYGTSELFSTNLSNKSLLTKTCDPVIASQTFCPEVSSTLLGKPSNRLLTGIINLTINAVIDFSICNDINDNDKQIVSLDHSLSTTIHDLLDKQLPSRSIVINPVDPFSADVQNRLIDYEFLSNQPNFVQSNIALPDKLYENCLIGPTDQFWRILNCCGSGTFADVYCAQLESDGDSGSTDIFALKVQKRHDVWEYQILTTLFKRLEDNHEDPLVISAFSKVDLFIKLPSFSIVKTQYFHYGSLLNLVNWHLNENKSIPYYIVTVYTLELLKIAQVLHKYRIIHADFKTDNILIRFIYPNNESNKANLTPLVLTDFNRSIDLTLFPPGTNFLVPSDLLPSQRCPQIRESLPWTFEIDQFGILDVVHTLIFRSYLEIDYDTTTSCWKPKRHLPRKYRNKPFWSNLFTKFMAVNYNFQENNANYEGLINECTLELRELDRTELSACYYLRTLNTL